MNRHLTQLLISAILAGSCYQNAAQEPANPSARYVTNAPAVYLVTNIQQSLLNPENTFQSELFHHYLPDSLHNAIWTNFIAHTNQRSTTIWSVRTHPPKWPATPPIVEWNAQSIMWGMRGLTALSPCWESEGSSGQAPITALTKRHGYTRGHGMGPDGFGKSRRGQKVWFLTVNNALVEARIAREVIRVQAGSPTRDYTIFLFEKDLPDSIQPMAVFRGIELDKKYPRRRLAPLPYFLTEQGGQVSAEVVGFKVNTWKGGDSGSPNMLPLPGQLVFLGGRSTSGASPEMQADMDELCKQQGLDPKKYRLQWLDLSAYPSYE